ncbi:hypothetical protein K488DRAFT_90336 [Vararia minispora EC-137]|uniref:Uncharacterized protein n=1 Tax=Vararia minispora EC-137 TaxID=1314806 RepID=A0ACB8Q9I4_9AGAM|nr:hypothetical protein K488DRAFT_90336 [Vararia minispora EC-137]
MGRGGFARETAGERGGGPGFVGGPEGPEEEEDGEEGDADEEEGQDGGGVRVLVLDALARHGGGAARKQCACIYASPRPATIVRRGDERGTRDIELAIPDDDGLGARTNALALANAARARSAAARPARTRASADSRHRATAFQHGRAMDLRPSDTGIDQLRGKQSPPSSKSTTSRPQDSSGLTASRDT